MVEDQNLVRDAIVALLSSRHDIEIVGEAGSAADTLESFDDARPDVVVLDIGLGAGMDGIELCRELRSRRPETRTLILTGTTDETLVMQAVMAGAVGYTTKGIALKELPDTICRVHAGESMIDPAALDSLMRGLGGTDASQRGSYQLTEREGAILELIGEGLTNRQIGDRLHLAEQTVKNYVSNLLGKLGLQRRTQAAVYASRRAAPSK